MSYGLSLDEVAGVDLAREVERRFKLRLKCLCDYCGRKPTTPSCKFPERHRAHHPSKLRKAVRS